MAGPAANAGPVSVLLAEHEPEVAEMSARYLRADGLQVRLVATPETALTELTYGPDAAAVLDLTMPGLDPRRIRRALRTPVIFLVSGPRPRGLARVGARRWLSRPFSPRQLVGMVRDVLTLPEHVPSRPAGRSAGGLRLDGPSRTVITGGEPGPALVPGGRAGAADRDRVRDPRGHDGPPGPGSLPAIAARRRGSRGGRRPVPRSGTPPRPAQGRA